MTMEVSKVLRLPRHMQLSFWKRRKSICKSIAPVTQNDFRHFIKHVRLSKCHACQAKRHYNLFGNIWKWESFAASPKDTATPLESQRIETRHVAASKRAFRARHLPIFTLCSDKIEVFLRVFPWTSKFVTSKSMFRARLPSIFSTSCKTRRLPWNLHLVTTWRSPDIAIRKSTQHDTSKVLRVLHKMTMMVSKVLRLPQKNQRIFWKRRKSIVLAAQNVFRHDTKHVWMSRSATPARRNEATRRWNLKKWPFCRTHHRHGHMALTRTVADGCGLQPPWPESETGTLATHSGKCENILKQIETDILNVFYC